MSEIWKMALQFAIGNSPVIVFGVLALWLIWRYGRKVVHFIDDLKGESPRPGLPEGRPGLMVRLGSVESTLAEFRPLLAELSEDSEMSIKDRITRIDNKVVQLDQRLEIIEHNTCEKGT